MAFGSAAANIGGAANISNSNAAVIVSDGANIVQEN